MNRSQLGGISLFPQRLKDYDWPTVAFVEDTLQVAPDRVPAVIDQANRKP